MSESLVKVYKGKRFRLYHGDMLDMLEVIKPGSIDSVITDPPYELGFMNKKWDNTGIAFNAGTWKRCYEALKPGGYLLAFGGSRTYHRIACAIEDAGFEIRDTIMWIYGSGFPKSMDLSKSIEAKLTTGSANTQEFKNLNGERADRGTLGFATMQHEQGARPNDYGKLDVDRLGKLDATTNEAKQWGGWGTALKPAFEPVIVARKPCVGSTTDNVLEFGVGGINIDECRIGTEYIGGGTAPSFKDAGKQSKEAIGIDKLSFGQTSNVERIEYEGHEGRFPSNIILTYDETDKEEVCGGFPIKNTPNGSIKNPNLHNSLGDNIYGKYSEKQPLWDAYADSGSASRYFYCAKASKRDRDEGLNDFEDKVRRMSNQALAEMKRGNTNFDGGSANTIGLNRVVERKNIHPTVKPTSLMQYLIRLVTPKGGVILDPFSGSGSTGKAAMYENKDRGADYKYIGIELSEEYLPIANARIRYVCSLEKGEKANGE